jgi:two-component system LytT family response regulator
MLMKWNKVFLPTAKGGVCVYPQELVFCEAEGQWTHVTIDQSTAYKVNLTLKELHYRLDFDPFLRCHHSYLVNLFCIQEIIGDFKAILVITGDEIPISQRKRAEVKALIASGR